MHRNTGELGSRGPADPRTLAQFSSLLTRAKALTQATEPMVGTVLLGCILYVCRAERQSKLGKVGLERMPFLKGRDHALVRQDIGSSAKFEPSLSPDL